MTESRLIRSHSNTASSGDDDRLGMQEDTVATMFCILHTDLTQRMDIFATQEFSFIQVFCLLSLPAQFYSRVRAGKAGLDGGTTGGHCRNSVRLRGGREDLVQSLQQNVCRLQGCEPGLGLN